MSHHWTDEMQRYHSIHGNKLSMIVMDTRECYIYMHTNYTNLFVHVCTYI